MSEIKQQKIFQASDKDLKVEVSDIDLQTQRLFEQNAKFVPQKMDQELNDIDIAAPLLKNKTHWSLKVLISGFLGLTVWQSVDYIINAIKSADFLMLGWAGLIGLAATIGARSLVGELWTLRKLKNRVDVQHKAAMLIQGNAMGQAVTFCQTLAKQGLVINSAEYARWQSNVEAHHNDAEVFEMYDSIVLAEQDKQARQVITKHACESALMVALSPLAVVDMLLVAWRNIRLIEQVSNIYGVKLGYFGRLRLFKMVLQNMAFVGATEIVTDVGGDVLTTSIAGKLSARAAQGLGIGLLTARFGLKTMSLMRPLPWQKDQTPKLSDMRKVIMGQLAAKVTDKNAN